MRTREQAELDEHRGGVARRQPVTFDEWADEFERITEGRVKAGDMVAATVDHGAGRPAHGRAGNHADT